MSTTRPAVEAYIRRLENPLTQSYAADYYAYRLGLRPEPAAPPSLDWSEAELVCLHIDGLFDR